MRGKATKELLENFNIIRQAKKLVLGWKISQKTYHEIKHANTLIRHSNRIIKSQCYMMDNGYDSKKSTPN
jgi:hypothetical protein